MMKSLLFIPLLLTATFVFAQSPIETAKEIQNKQINPQEEGRHKPIKIAWFDSIKMEIAKIQTSRKIQSFDQRLDSVVTRNNVGANLQDQVKEVYHYANFSSINLTERFVKNQTTNAWDLFEKDEVTFNLNGDVILVQRFQLHNGNWILIQKNELDYDANGYEILFSNLNRYAVTDPLQGFKYDFVRDAQGNILENVHSNWDDNSASWESSRKSIYAYTASGLVTLDSTLNWESTLQIWQNSYVFKTSFDQMDRPLIRIRYNYMPMGVLYHGLKEERVYTSFGADSVYETSTLDTNNSTWTPHQKMTYFQNSQGADSVRFRYLFSSTYVLNNAFYFFYNATGLLNNLDAYNYPSGSSNPYISSRYTYSYNSNGALIHTLYETGQGGGLVNSSQRIFDYDGQGNEDLQIYYNWFQGSWNGIWKYHLVYNAQGEIVEIQHDKWNTNTSMWDKSALQLYTYNQNGQSIYQESQQWVNGGWQNLSIHEWLYSGLDELIMHSSKFWDNQLNAWVGIQKAEAVVNPVFTIPNIQVPLSYRFKTMELDSFIYAWDAGSTSWIVDLHSEFYWTSFTNSVAQVTPDEISVYPNPAKDFIQIDFRSNQGKLSVFDITGKLLVTRNITSTEKVDVSNLSQGTYLYRIEWNGESQLGRFVKQ